MFWLTPHLKARCFFHNPIYDIFPLKEISHNKLLKNVIFFAASVKFSVIGSVPHQSTSRFESHRRFCVGNIFPTNANFPSPNARKISIVASFFMCCTVPPLRYAYINKNNNNNYYYFLWSNRSSLLRKMDPGLGSEFENKQHDGNFSVIVLETKTVSDLCLHQSLTILRQLLLAFG